MTAPPNFNRLARAYRWMEYLSFGPLLQRCRCHFLPRLAAAELRTALVLGDGDGRFTARLLAASPGIHVDAVDASTAMLRQLESRTLGLSVTTHCADARLWHPDRTGYDLVATHFFLDCLTTTEVASLVQRLTPATAENAHWLVSEFAQPTTAFGRLVAAPLVALLYKAFRGLTGLEPQTLPQHRLALSQAGWRLEADRPRLFGMLVSELWRRDHRLAR